MFWFPGSIGDRISPPIDIVLVASSSIPLTELVSNLQTYEIGLTRIGKSGKSKSMALMAKSNDTDESSNDEDSKMKSYITKQFKKFMKNANGKGIDKDGR